MLIGAIEGEEPRDQDEIAANNVFWMTNQQFYAFTTSRVDETARLKYSLSVVENSLNILQVILFTNPVIFTGWKDAIRKRKLSGAIKEEEPRNRDEIIATNNLLRMTNQQLYASTKRRVDETGWLKYSSSVAEEASNIFLVILFPRRLLLFTIDIHI